MPISSNPVVPPTLNPDTDIVGSAERVEAALRTLLESPQGKADTEVSNTLFTIHEMAFNHADVLREQKSFIQGMARTLTGFAHDLKSCVEVAAEGVLEDDDLEEEDQVSVGEWVQSTFPMLRGPKNRAIDVIVQAITLGLAVGLTETELVDAFRFPFVRRSRGELPDEQDAVGPVLRAIYAYAHEGRFDSQEPLDLEMSVLRDTPATELLKQLRDDITAGLPVVSFTPPDAPAGAPHELEG